MASRGFNWTVTSPTTICNIAEPPSAPAVFLRSLWRAISNAPRDESETAELFFLKVNDPGSPDGPFHIDFAAPGPNGQHSLRITTREALVERVEALKAQGIRPSQSEEALRLVDLALAHKARIQAAPEEVLLIGDPR